MAVSHNDRYLLGTDSKFQNRCQASLLTTAIAIQSEAPTAAYHRERDIYVAAIMSTIALFNDAVQRHSFACATDANVIGDATQGGTVTLTSANVDNQQALVTDAHIDAAMSAQFDTFFRTPGF